MKWLKYPIIEGFLETKIIGKVILMGQVKQDYGNLLESIALIPTFKKNKKGQSKITSFQVVKLKDN